MLNKYRICPTCIYLNCLGFHRANLVLCIKKRDFGRKGRDEFKENLFLFPLPSCKKPGRFIMIFFLKAKSRLFSVLAEFVKSLAGRDRLATWCVKRF